MIGSVSKIVSRRNRWASNPLNGDHLEVAVQAVCSSKRLAHIDDPEILAEIAWDRVETTRRRLSHGTGAENWY